MEENAIEIYQSPDGKSTFYFTHSDENQTTGVLVLLPGAALTKHNRPNAIENLTQVSGKCLMTLFDAGDKPSEIELNPGEGVRMPKGQWHIHANPYDEVSVTLFKAEGDILDIMRVIRAGNKKLDSNKPKNL